MYFVFDLFLFVLSIEVVVEHTLKYLSLVNVCVLSISTFAYTFLRFVRKGS